MAGKLAPYKDYISELVPTCNATTIADKLYSEHNVLVEPASILNFCKKHNIKLNKNIGIPYSRTIKEYSGIKRRVW
jgi:hypothetical protein